MRFRISTVLSLLGCLAVTLQACAQITTIEDYHGRRIACSISGLRGAYSFCGIDKTNNHPFIFRATILSVTPVEAEGFHEFRLVVQPAEAFRGHPDSQITLTTRQGECLDHDTEIHPGDDWLFFVSKDEKTNGLIAWYNSGSGPVEKSATLLTLVRLQKQHPESGFVIGYVSVDSNKSISPEGSSVENEKHHEIRIRRRSNGEEQSVKPDDKGRFQFPPLAPGDYDLNPNTSPGLWAEPVQIDVHPTSCAEVPIELAPDGTITGTVVDLNGKPIQDADVEVSPSDGPLGTGSAVTDRKGHYEIHGLPPGRFYVGLGIGEPFKVYYPNAIDQAGAVAISLILNEHRNNIDFHLTRPFKP